MASDGNSTTLAASLPNIGGALMLNLHMVQWGANPREAITLFNSIAATVFQFRSILLR